MHCYPQQPGLKGITKKVKVVYSINPLNFYCQLDENSELFSDMMLKLNATFEGNFYLLHVNPTNVFS